MSRAGHTRNLFSKPAVKANECLPQALRSVSASLLTDLTALDLDTLDRTLEFLANNEAQIETQVLPGDEQAGRYALNEESLAAVQSFFNVSPTDGQASSASEP